MKISGWGKSPVVDAKILNPQSPDEVLDIVSTHEQRELVSRGLGRSYGDSSLADTLIETKYLDHFLAFDKSSGLLTCDAGVSLADILTTFVPKGWFLPVTPGTKFVSIGGAIACDVHGKNHHKEGSFCDHVESLKVATVSHGIVECSREQHPELFLATCGGMGLTGVILETSFRLKPIKSAYIDELTIKANNLEDAIALFDEYASYTYSVAWIDCLSTGGSLGRSIVMLGEHSETGDFSTGGSAKLSVPVDMPGILLNKYSIQAFNTLYYHKTTKKRHEAHTHYEPFFYPLDGILNWNRMYGKNGFTQYQFVLPKSAGANGMHEILERIADSKKGSFLAVLKAFGKGNHNYLSFPREGYTLALDFKLDNEVLRLLNRLDEVVASYGGRLYTCKDSRMSQEMFRKCYEQWEKFVETRQNYGADKVFNSLQSRRLGL
jgi:FAD/FMN-containing dehydrogenase